MDPARAIALIDGFNLYHAVLDLRQGYLKWLDLHKLCRAFLPSPQFALERVLYFTALATWKPQSLIRHRAYLRALEATGVEVVTAKFKESKKFCRTCKASWVHHEEKETDVSIGVHLVDLAYQDTFDRALLLTGDSDLAPAVRIVKQRFPAKQIALLTPPGRSRSYELVAACGTEGSRVRLVHLQRALLPERTACADGSYVMRPAEYCPPRVLP